MQEMHRYTQETEDLARALEDYTRARIADLPPLDGPASPEDLSARAGETITPEGIGGERALRIWADVLAPATISTDHPAFLAFVPGAPTRASVLFDLVLSASSTYGGSWLEGAGAVWAENQTLRWLADLVGLPPPPGAASCPVGRPGTCRRSSPPGTTPRPAAPFARLGGRWRPRLPLTPRWPRRRA
jgi:L-2,4-diaminobutyrate decarboxylase